MNERMTYCLTDDSAYILVRERKDGSDLLDIEIFFENLKVS